MLNKVLNKVVLLAILLRLLAMILFFHPDIKTYSFQTSFLRQGVFNIYDYLSSHKSTLPLKEDFVYFPLTYFTLGGYQALVSPILGAEFQTWLADAGQSAISRPGIYAYLFFLKLPYLVLDLSLAFLLTHFFADRDQKKRVFYFWLFNPFSLSLIYIFSNVDIFPVLFTVLTLLYLKQKKLILAAVCLGIAAAFKAYPLLLLPFLLFTPSSIYKRTVLLILPILIFGLTLIPFIHSTSFKNATLASGLTTRMITSGLPIGFNEQIFVSLVLFAALFFLGFFKKINFNHLFLISFLGLFATIHYHIQWLLWLMPFLIITIIANKKLTVPLITLLLIMFAIPLTYNDSAMNFALFSPVSATYLSLPTLYTLISKIYDPLVVQSILHSLLLGGVVMTSVVILKDYE